MSGDDAYPMPGVSAMETIAEWEAFFSASASAPAGVIAGVANELIGTLNSGTRQAVIGTGAALIRGFYKPFTSPVGTAIPGADTQDRVDRLVLRLDRTAVTAANLVKPAVITGTPGSVNPPAIQASLSPTGSWDLPIARWTSEHGGGLAGLVDERYWLADITMFNSAARPSASPARPGFERDTKRWLWADGSTWTEVGAFEDSGFSNLSLSSGWTQGTVPLAMCRMERAAYLAGKCSHAAAISTTTGSKICDIPAGRTPRKSHDIPVYQDGGTLLLATAYASSERSGELWLTGNLGNFSRGASLHFHSNWPA